MRTTLTAGVIVLFAGLVVVCTAAASIRLPISYSRQQSVRLARKLCESEHGCESSEVTSCGREAGSRVDCTVLADYNEGNTVCSYIVINQLRETTFRERTKDATCSKSSIGQDLNEAAAVAGVSDLGRSQGGSDVARIVRQLEPICNERSIGKF